MFGFLKQMRRAPVEYSKAKRLARDGDPGARRELARRAGAQPEILYFLAEDPAPEVRRAVARNPATPRQADLLLAGDAVGDVRSDLAEKLARLMPELTPDEHDKLYQVLVETLEILARDQLVRVRRILAEALRDVAHAPPEVVRRLARDSELTVCAPILEYSPILSDDDLLEIIASGPVQGARGAISRRRQVVERVADAVIASGDVDAITDLLANRGAQIREATLDIIIERAPTIASWHEPLVWRPRLSAQAVCRIARFVAHSLVESLRGRSDLDPETLNAVAKAVDQRLREEAEGGRAKGKTQVKPKNKKDAESGSASDDGKFDPGWDEHDEAAERAREMVREGKLDEEAITEALACGDRRLVTAALALLGALPEEMVSKAASLQSAKGIVAITWKAGLSMRLAVQLQLQLARVAPDTVLRPAADGAFPLNCKELEWEIEFLQSMGV